MAGSAFAGPEFKEALDFWRCSCGEAASSAPTAARAALTPMSRQRAAIDDAKYVRTELEPTSATAFGRRRRRWYVGGVFRDVSEPPSTLYRVWHSAKNVAKVATHQRILAVIAVDGTSEASSGTYRRPARRSIARADAQKTSPKYNQSSGEAPKRRPVTPRVFRTSRGLGGPVATGWGPGFTRWGEGHRAKVEGAACCSPL